MVPIPLWRVVKRLSEEACDAPTKQAQTVGRVTKCTTNTVLQGRPFTSIFKLEI